ncbi:MAG: NAD(P)/FAD-dependent oxidoreductase [Hungatella sp.]
MKKTVIVIGGGASGMMAAITAAGIGAKVILLEHTDRIGKKLLATGNGRCNLTNLCQSASCYRSSQPEFPFPLIERYSVERTIAFFRELGILTKNKNGYIYPYSEQASAVLEVLRMEILHRKIDILYECEVQKMKPSWQIETNQGSYHADAVILATGSKAAPVTGSDGSGYRLAKSLGHSIIEPLPALVALRCKEKHYKQLAGIRTEAMLTLQADGLTLAQESGELQLTEYGISGIPTFQISRYASAAQKEGREVRVLIDFMPQLSQPELETFLKDRRKATEGKTCEEWLIGTLHKKLIPVLLKLAGIRAGDAASSITNRQWNEFIKQIKSYETFVIGTNPYEQAQVCCGGVDTREVSSTTLESKLVKNLYFAGELLDVDGICGGYNLQWAWSSGCIAGTYAGGASL